MEINLIQHLYAFPFCNIREKRNQNIETFSLSILTCFQLSTLHFMLLHLLGTSKALRKDQDIRHLKYTLCGLCRISNASAVVNNFGLVLRVYRSYFLFLFTYSIPVLRVILCLWSYVVIRLDSSQQIFYEFEVAISLLYFLFSVQAAIQLSDSLISKKMLHGFIRVERREIV